jgi:hypothetical protein
MKLKLASKQQNFLSASLVLLMSSVWGGIVQSSMAQQYAPIPAGTDQKQYEQCLIYSNSIYSGGEQPSPYSGVTKSQAWCQCMWHETPEDFFGNLVGYAETPKGKKANSICERYADWK